MNEAKESSPQSSEQASEQTREQLTPDQIQNEVQKLRELDMERADLGYRLYQLTGETNTKREGRETSGQFIFDFDNEKTQIQEEKLHLDQEIKIIKSGKVGEIIPRSSVEDSSRQRLVRDIEKRQKDISGQIDSIISNPDVSSAYNQFRQQKIEIIKKMREVGNLQAFSERLDQESASILKKGGGNITEPEKQALARIRSLKTTAIERVGELQKEPEVAREMRIRELLDYKRQLERYHFAETPSRRRYEERIMSLWLRGRVVLLTGETGGGKTELLKSLFRKYWHGDPHRTLVSCTEFTTDYTIFGKPGGWEEVEGEEHKHRKVTDVRFAPGPGTIAIEEGLPLILDEFNNMDQPTRFRLKAVYNLRPGVDRYTIQEDSQYAIPVKSGFCIGATANIKSEKHKERFELDAAENRVFDEEKIEYLPKEELFDLCLAKLMDRRGRLSLQGRSDAIEVLKNLVDAAEFIQQTYMGVQTQITEAGGATKKVYAQLEQAVLDPGKVLGLMEGWQKAEAQGEDIGDFIEEQLLSFINKEGYPEKDRKLLVQIFVQKYGYFQDKSTRDFLVPSLTEQELGNWKTTKKKGP